jgi:flagellar motor protein MotB
VPGKLKFQIQKADLSADGNEFLKNYIPEFAHILCSNDYRSSIESIVVEGHTDKQKFGRTPEESANNNLKLSQDRSMAVVEAALSDLNDNKPDRACFLEKLSATGRGEQDATSQDDAENRRVIFRIRIKVRDEDNMVRRLAQ